MDQFDEVYRGRLTALLRAMSVAKGVKDDDVPCLIEEVKRSIIDDLDHGYFC